MAWQAARLGPPPEVGEVLAVPPADGQSGAGRVLGVRREGHGTERRASYVVATRYVGPEPPAREHRALRKALVLTCDDDDEPFAWWVLGPPPAAYVPAGVIRPKPEEKPPRRHGKRRTGWAEYAHYIPRQWQSDHARDMFLAAEAVEREPGADRPGCAQDD
jgi:hypothetical protein